MAGRDFMPWQSWLGALRRLASVLAIWLILCAMVGRRLPQLFYVNKVIVLVSQVLFFLKLDK